jgi:hypothetical protein
MKRSCIFIGDFPHFYATPAMDQVSQDSKNNRKKIIKIKQWGNIVIRYISIKSSCILK